MSTVDTHERVFTILNEKRNSIFIRDGHAPEEHYIMKMAEAAIFRENHHKRGKKDEMERESKT